MTSVSPFSWHPMPNNCSLNEMINDVVISSSFPRCFSFCRGLRSSQSFLLECRTLSFKNMPSLFPFPSTPPPLPLLLYLFCIWTPSILFIFCPCMLIPNILIFLNVSHLPSICVSKLIYISISFFLWIYWNCGSAGDSARSFLENGKYQCK